MLSQVWTWSICQEYILVLFRLLKPLLQCFVTECLTMHFSLFSHFFPLKFPKLLRQGMEEMNKYHKTDCLQNTTGLLIHTYDNCSFKIAHKNSNPSECSIPIPHLMKDACLPVVTYRIPKSASEFRPRIDIRTLVYVSTFTLLLCSPDHFAKVGKYCCLGHG